MFQKSAAFRRKEGISFASHSWKSVPVSVRSLRNNAIIYNRLNEERSSMNTIVCVKQVLDPEIPPAKFKIDPEAKTGYSSRRSAACDQCI